MILSDHPPYDSVRHSCLVVNNTRQNNPFYRQKPKVNHTIITSD